jgi:Photosynthesis system II assembly factor YCF48
MNPRDNEREFGAMLKRGLASGPAAAESEHLDADVLAAYFERTLTANEIRACDLHVSNCAHCRSELAALARAEPESDEVSGSRPFAWLWNWRFLVPVTAAVAMFVAFATVWGPVRSRDGRGGPPIVAQNQEPVAAPQVPPPNSEMVEVSPSPAENTKKPGAAAPPQAKSADSLGRLDGRPAASGNRPPRASQAPEAPRAERREFKKEKDRGASEANGDSAGAGAGRAAGGGNDQEKQNARGAAAAPSYAPPPAPPATSNETVDVTSSQASQSAQAAQPAAAPSSSPGNSTTSGATGKNVTGSKAAAAPRGGSGVRGAGIGGTAGGIAAQKTAPAEAETVTSRFKPDESAPIVIPTPDASIMWRVAGAHEIQLSQDVGATWRPQLTETNVRLITGSAPSPKICWVVGRGGTILRTVDGENWETVKSPTKLDLTGVAAQNADVATITASDGSNYETKNGGAKWKHIKKPH